MFLWLFRTRFTEFKVFVANTTDLVNIHLETNIVQDNKVWIRQIDLSILDTDTEIAS